MKSYKEWVESVAVPAASIESRPFTPFINKNFSYSLLSFAQNLSMCSHEAHDLAALAEDQNHPDQIELRRISRKVHEAQQELAKLHVKIQQDA